MLKERIRDHSSFPKVQETDFPGGSDGKESACNAGDWVQYLGQENLQEEEMLTLSSILTWRIPWTEELGTLQTNTHKHRRPGSVKESQICNYLAKRLRKHVLFPPKELHSNSSVAWFKRRKWHPTPVSCLENPMDGGAWWAAVHGVAKSRTRLKRLSSSRSSR